MLLIALLLQAAPAAAPAPWTPRERTDAATGAKSLTVGISARDGGARLAVRCDANVPVVSVQFISKIPLGASPDRTVESSFDGGAATPFDWEFPGTAAFVRDSATVTELAAQIAKAKTITLKTNTTANAVVTATFDGPPSDAPIKAVLAACGYTLGEVPLLKEAEPTAK